MFFFQLILHPSAFLSRYDDNLEETGSGDDDIFSGSGESPISDLSEVYVDDEDFNIRQRPLQVGFLCEVMMTSYTPEQVCYIHTLFGYGVGVPRSLRTRHIQHPRHTQFYAPTLASKKEFGLCPIPILRLFALSTDVGHWNRYVTSLGSVVNILT